MNLTVNNRIVLGETVLVIGDNADYTAHFTFDSEWDDKIKTARFENEKLNVFKDVLLDNDSCTIPIEVLKSGFVKVGVFTSTMTTNYWKFYVNASIKDDNGSPVVPTPDIYSQIVSMIQELSENGVNDEQLATAIENYLTEHPIESLDEDDVIALLTAYIQEHRDELKGADGTNGNNGTNGQDGRDGVDGQDGADGFSPTVSITDIYGGKRITITDANGNHPFDILNGAKGEDGEKGETGASGADGYSPTVAVTNISGGKRVTITDKNGSHPFDILNGTKGDDGVSPTVTITNITNGKRITITDVNGDHPFDIYNGTGGSEVSPEDIASAVEAYLTENPIEGITEDDIADLRELNYDNLGTFTINYKANTYSSSYPYVKLFELTPTDYTNPCIVDFKIESNVHDNPKANWVHDCEMTFAVNDQNYINNPAYYFHNRGAATSYRDFYTIAVYQPKVIADKTNYMIPVCIKMSGEAYKYNTVDRDFKITITKLRNCTVALTTEHVGKNSSQLVAHTSDYFGWIERTQVSTVGAVHTGDADTQNRTHLAMGLKVSDYPLYRYTLVGEKLDGTIAPFCTNNKTSASNGLRTPNTTTKFRLGGKFYYYNTSNNVVNVGETTASWVLYSDIYYATEARYWISTANGEITIQGNNISGTSSEILNRPLYLIALDNEDGTYNLDSSLSTTDISYHLATELPSADDGHIYIEVGGIGTSKTTFMLADNHPVYKWSGTAYTLYGMGDGDYVLTSTDKAEIAELVTADVASVELTQTLTAGQTTIVFNDASITSDSIIDIYVDKWGVNPTSVETISGKVTIQFGAQAANMSVKIIVKNPLVDVLSRDVEEVYVGTIQPSASEGYKLWIDPTEAPNEGGGGNSPELLWTNSGANNAQFAAQTISLNLSDYKAVEIIFLVHSGYSSHVCQRCYLALTDRIFVGAYDEPTSTVVFYDRIVKPTTSGVQFYDGTNNGATDNAVCVPRYIYGIK